MKKIIFLPVCLLFIISCKKSPTADFSIIGTTKVGETIQFTNSSTNSDNYIWDFGDGSTSTEESPSHIYEKPGDYIVMLEAKGEGGSSAKSKSLKITGITYSFKNNSDYTLYSFYSYYWTGDDIEDWTEHGTLAKGAETDIVITERTEIDFAFYSSADKTEICISADPYTLTIDMHNDLIINDNTSVFCTDVKSASFNSLEDNEKLAGKINAIRSLLNTNKEEPRP